VKGACLGFTSYSTGSCSGVHVCLFQSHPLGALLILILWHCHAISGWLLAWKLPDEYTLSAVTRFRWLLTCQAEEPEPIHEKTLRLKPWAMCCYALPLMINWWKYMIDFVEIQFYSNEDIEWHCMHLEFNFNLVDLNSNSIEEKWDSNWYRNYWNFSCD
jgi:hypothetical protein